MACKPPNVFEPWSDDLYKELDKKIGNMILNGGLQFNEVEIKSKNIFEGKKSLKYRIKSNNWAFLFKKACNNGLIEDVKFYISNVNTKNENGESPLIIGKWIEKSN